MNVDDGVGLIRRRMCTLGSTELLVRQDIFLQCEVGFPIVEH